MTHNLLVFSDLHLTLHLDEESRATDRELVLLLGHYARELEGGLPWRLVLAGDLFDFVYPDMELFLERYPDTQDGFPERPTASPKGFLEHWDVKAVSWRLAVTMEEHAELFAALARFVLAGNRLALIVGNHDVEMHWARLQRTFLERWAAIARREDLDAPVALLSERTRFHPWFYLEAGRIYVEHGNQYDEFNALPNFLDPALVTDPDRAFAPMGSRLTHYLTNAFPDYRPRPIPGAFPKYLKETGQSWSKKYISRSLTVLSHSLVNAGLFSEEGWKTGVGREDEALQHIEAETGLPLPTLEALRGLQTAPVTAQGRWVYNRFLVDRAFVVLFGLMVLGLGLGFGVIPAQEPALHAALVGGPLALVAGALLRLKMHIRFGRIRWILPFLLSGLCAAASLLGEGGTLRGGWLSTFTVFVVACCIVAFPVAEVVDMKSHYLRSARQIARLLRVPTVVFGHSHQPLDEDVGDGARYFNCGGWVNSGIDKSHAHVVVTGETATLVRGRDYLGGEG